MEPILSAPARPSTCKGAKGVLRPQGPEQSKQELQSARGSVMGMIVRSGLLSPRFVRYLRVCDYALSPSSGLVSESAFESALTIWRCVKLTQMFYKRTVAAQIRAGSDTRHAAAYSDT